MGLVELLLACGRAEAHVLLGGGDSEVVLLGIDDGDHILNALAAGFAGSKAVMSGVARGERVFIFILLTWLLGGRGTWLCTELGE